MGSARSSGMTSDTFEDPTPRGSAKPVDVLVATPFGRGGRGGIDRLMDALREDARSGRFKGCRVRFGATRGAVPLILSPVYFLHFCLRMMLLRAFGRLDVVHINVAAHGSAHRKAAIGRVAQWMGVPYIIHLHGSRFRSFFDSAAPSTRAKMRRFFTDAHRILVLGAVWSDYVETNFPATCGRIVVLPNATASFGPIKQLSEDERIRIVFLGQLGARKGVPELVSALAAISDLDDWQAVLAGDGAVEETRARISELGLSSRVEIPGWVDADTATSLLETADILVLPSHDENLPMSVIEGMAAGLAVVATPVGAVEDIITDGKTGLLVPPGDVDALAAGLRRLVVNEDLRAKLGMAAVAFHRQHLEIGAYDRRLATIWREAASSNAITEEAALES